MKYWYIYGLYPLVMTNIAIENGPVEIVQFFSIKKMVIFQFAICKRFTEGESINILGLSHYHPSKTMLNHTKPY